MKNKYAHLDIPHKPNKDYKSNVRMFLDCSYLYYFRRCLKNGEKNLTKRHILHKYIKKIPDWYKWNWIERQKILECLHDTYETKNKYLSKFEQLKFNFKKFLDYVSFN